MLRKAGVKEEKKRRRSDALAGVLESDKGNNSELEVLEPPKKVQKRGQDLPKWDFAQEEEEEEEDNDEEKDNRKEGKEE